MSYVIISKWESFNKKKPESGAFREVRWQDSGGRVSGRGEVGHWSSWWDWSPGSNSLRRQDWSKRRNVLTGTDVKCQDEERVFFFLFTAIMLYIFTEIYQNQQEQLNACMMQKRRTDLGQSWASCWTRRPPDLRCPQGRCWRLNHSTHWESRLQQEGSESIWINPNLLSGLLSHLLSSVSWWAWTERGCSACPWTQPPGRWAQRSSQVRWKLVQAAWLRLSSSQFFWVTRRKLGLCCPHTTSSSLCS